MGADPAALLGPMAEEVCELAGRQRYGGPAAVRDEAVRLRALLVRHRRVESLRSAGRVVLAVDGEGEVVIDGGLWAGGERWIGTDAPGIDADGEGGLDQERAIVAQWLGAHADILANGGTGDSGQRQRRNRH